MIKESNSRLLGIVALAGEYCAAVEDARDTEKADFIASMLNYLPRLYWEFGDIVAEDSSLDEEAYYPNFIDEDYYESIRLRMETLLGADDTYLETFEEDMKYSDTPIGASISEGLADIYQDLFNFVSAVRESEGADLETAFLVCKENFAQYWGQTLCNVMRPLNHLRYARQDA